MTPHTNAFIGHDDRVYEAITQLREEAIRSWNHIDQQFGELGMKLSGPMTEKSGCGSDCKFELDASVVDVVGGSTRITVHLSEGTIRRLQTRADIKGIAIEEFIKRHVLCHLLFGQELLGLRRLVSLGFALLRKDLSEAIRGLNEEKSHSTHSTNKDTGRVLTSRTKS